MEETTMANPENRMGPIALNGDRGSYQARIEGLQKALEALQPGSPKAFALSRTIKAMEAALRGCELPAAD
jgi:hypothetical protein